MTTGHPIVHLDELVTVCGYFHGKSPVNNGYGCRHPKQEDKEPAYLASGKYGKRKYGRCFAHTCPLASELDPSEPEHVAKFEAEGIPLGDSYLEVHNRATIRRLGGAS